MTRVFIFNALQVAASAYAIGRGGAPERLAGAALLAAAGGTWLLQSPAAVRFVGVELGVLAVDVILLAVLLVIALHADRWWTLWMTALHALGTGAHFVRFVDQDVLRFVYALLTATWSYPILVLLTVGTARHRLRIRRSGHDLDWTRLHTANKE